MFNIVASIGAVAMIGSALLIGPIEEEVPQQINQQEQIVCQQAMSVEIKTGNKDEEKLPKKEKNIIAPEQIDLLINKYSQEYGVDPNLMKKIAKCESTFNANAVNGPYAGLYQFVDTTWISTRKTMELETNPDLRFNAEEAIRTASFKISRGGKMAWKNCL